MSLYDSKFPKFLRIREEDYWVHAITVPTVFFVAVAIYASAMPFKLPTIVLGVAGLLFSTQKFARDYGSRRAAVHVVLTVAMAALLALFIHLLTN